MSTPRLYEHYEHMVLNGTFYVLSSCCKVSGWPKTISPVVYCSKWARSWFSSGLLWS